ncbi:MAG: hypothetical protein V3V79_02860 [Gammaproteobacteria bacterium]
MNAVENDSLWSVDLSYLGILRVSGGDRRTFLQGQLTQDLDRLSPEKWIFSGWTSPKGRLLTIAQLFDWRDSIWLLMPADLIDDVAKRLAIYILRSDVQLEGCTIGIAGLGGPNSITTAQSLGITLADEPDASASTENLCVGRLAGDPTRLVAIGDLPPFPTPAPTKRDSNAWRLQNIRSGIPVIFAATSEAFLPQMVNLDLCGGVSFDKGCYTGQEIVARTQNLGRVKRRMFRFTYAAKLELAPGQTIFSAGRSVGHVVDGASLDAGTELLAVAPHISDDGNLALDEAGTERLNPEPMPYDVPGPSG